MEALDEYVAYRDQRDCTRDTQRGRRCTQPRMQWPSGAALPDPQSCHRHLTDAEQAAVSEAYQHQQEGADLSSLLGQFAPGSGISEEPLQVRHDRIAKMDPACWTWPAPESCTFPDENTARRFLRWWHNGMCAICGASEHGDLVCDHDHETGLVRGYLCQSCNLLEARGEGRFTKHRQRNPATILGIQIRYYSPFTGWAEPAPPLDLAARAAVDRLSLPSPSQVQRGAETLDDVER